MRAAFSRVIVSHFTNRCASLRAETVKSLLFDSLCCFVEVIAGEVWWFSKREEGK